MGMDRRVMSGTWGQVWVDGELWAELDGFQAKVTYNKESVMLCGSMMEGSKISSMKGTGSISVKKMYTRNHARTDSLMDGVDVRCTIVGKLADPDAYGAERVALYDVSFDDETIMDFTAGNFAKGTHPFTFGRREWLDLVSA